MKITYAIEPSVSLNEFLTVLNESGLADRRPTDDLECLQGMLDHSSLIVTARMGDRLVGIARSVTDFHYCCYLSDLAVSADVQKQGVGLALQQYTQAQLGPHCTLILISAPAALEYYPKIGYASCDRCFTAEPETPLASLKSCEGEC